MLYHSSRHFLLLLTVICIVKSNELKKIGGARKNFFDDIQDFFKRIFKPYPLYTKPPEKNNVTFATFDKDLKNTTYKQFITPTFFLKPQVKDRDSANRRADDREEENYVTNKRIQSASNLKTLIIIVTDNKKVYEEMVARGSLSYLGLSNSFTRDLNQTILRQAFGGACVKVAIRKCFKALRRVNDIVCSTRLKCKSSFKSTFLLKAKSGCITGFDYNGIFSQEKKTKTQEVMLYEE